MIFAPMVNAHFGAFDSPLLKELLYEGGLTWPETAIYMLSRPGVKKGIFGTLKVEFPGFPGCGRPL